MAGARLRRDGGSIPVTAWERLSRDAGVVGGRADWDLRLATLADDLEAEANRTKRTPTLPSGGPAAPGRQAEQARDLREFVLGLIDDLGRGGRAAVLGGTGDLGPPASGSSARR